MPFNLRGGLVQEGPKGTKSQGCSSPIAGLSLSALVQNPWIEGANCNEKELSCFLLAPHRGLLVQQTGSPARAGQREQPGPGSA